jgi:hypothetical protein
MTRTAENGDGTEFNGLNKAPVNIDDINILEGER